MYQNFFKRFLDIVISVFLFIILLPLIVIIIISVYLVLGRPIFFIQTRAGKNGCPFSIIKFRTMKNKDNQYSNDKERETKFGNVLRKLSFDELPELINVFLGQMSIVGPRPLYVEYNNLYNSDQKKRLTIRPGITGLAQINGRNSIKWEEKFKYDLIYLRNINLIGDIRIILITFFQVINKKNINFSDSQTMPLFRGKHDE